MAKKRTLVEDNFEQLQNDAEAGDEGIGDTDSEVVSFAPSTVGNPQMHPEEQDMEMKPVIVGPPAYGSPDPATSAGRLRALKDHPLADTLSEDYGEGYDITTTATTVSQPITPEPTDIERDAQGAGEGYENMKKDQLLQLAAERGIEGRSEMNKEELVEANKAYDEAQNEA